MKFCVETFCQWCESLLLNKIVFLLNIGRNFLSVLGLFMVAIEMCVQSLGHIWLFATQQLQHPRLSCPSPSPGACSNSCPLRWWYHLTISSSLIPFSSCLQSFPAAAAAKSLQSCLTLWPNRRQPTRLPHPWDSPGKNTGVGSHSLLQGILPPQGLNPGLEPWSPELQVDSLLSEPPGKPHLRYKFGITN